MCKKVYNRDFNILRALIRFLRGSFLGSIIGRLKTARLRYVKFRVRYNRDELITAHYPYFLQEQRFISALKSNFQFDPEPRVTIEHDWRIHVLCSLALGVVKGAEGDFIECGVFRGDCAKTIINYVDLNSTNRSFFLLDSFDGFDFSQLTEKESKLRGEGQFVGAFEFVTGKFRCDSCVKIIQGFVPNTLDSIANKMFGFAHIDMNAAYPEKEAFQFIFPRLRDGGVIIFDDYGHAGHEEQRLALDEVASGFGRVITCLPTGQGLLIK